MILYKIMVLLSIGQIIIFSITEYGFSRFNLICAWLIILTLYIEKTNNA